ncbi:MAG: adenylate/guanylate cyclase domain-containing protein [Caldimonas sp.]
MPPHLAERFRLGHAAHLAQHVGERKFITTLFADIKGSMALLDGMDPDVARQVIDPALRLMMNAVYRYEGYVAQALGDGIVALFGAPIAREDHACRALYAALTMQEQMKAYGERLLHEQGLPAIQIRVGINTGEVVVRSIPTDEGRADYAPIGHSVGLAARIESIAAPGSVVVSESTHQLTEGYFEFRAMASVPMKGVVANVKLYEVTGVGLLHTRLEVSASHGLSRFVGRRSELERMQAMLALADAGQAQIVGIIAEAGAGKSRLCHEFKLLARSECLVLECRSESYGKAFPYLPLIDMLKSHLQIAADDDDRRKLEKVTGRVLALDRSLEDAIPFLLALLGVADPAASIDHMDPHIRRRRTFDAIGRLVLREARDRPVLMVMEDLHWIDSESQGFLTLFGRAVEGARIMLLVNYRPEYQPSWDNATSHTQLRLNALGRDDAESLLVALLGADAALGPLKQLVIDRTQGNPFFMEEYVRTLFDHGILARGAEGIGLVRTLSSIEMPATVQGVLAARIDRLQPEDKAFLQMLAVLGMASPLRLIERFAPFAAAQLQEMLDRLQATEFILERPAFPDVEYVFKHALTREVAYGQLVADSRRSLHSRAAQAMEVLFSDRLDDYCSELAHHYARSDDLPKAVDFLQRAATQAMRRSAYVAAIDHVTSALTLLRDLADEAARDARELQLQAMLGSALMATRGFAVAEAAQAYERARELCRDTTDSADLVRVLAGLGLLYINRGELRSAREIGEELLHLAERRQEPKLVVSGHEILGLTLLRVGDLIDCRSHMELVVRHYDEDHDGALRDILGRDLKVSCLGFGALALWLLGYQDQALAGAAQALRAAHAATPRHPFSLAYAMLSSAWVHQFRGEASLALVEAESAKEFATEQGFPAWLAHALIVQGWAEAQLGRTESGLAHIEQGLTAYEATGAKVWQPLFLLLQVQALEQAGKTAQAAESITTALRLAREMGSYWWEAELFRVRGELLLALDRTNVAEAHTCFERACAIARTQNARSLELRACVSMARLARHHGGQAEARADLAAVCAGFAESSDSAELIEAREMLGKPG